MLEEPEYEFDDRTDMDDKIIDACGDRNLESRPYGVHDVTGGGVFGHDDVKYEQIFGFCTYEVPKNKVQELMEIWKDILNDLGFKTGDVIVCLKEEIK